MFILLSKDSKIPIYEQIVSAIKSKIMNGELKSGDKLPSIRSLSNSLEVSVITIKKSYDELEKLGLISTMPGKGSFVSEQEIENIREFKLNKIQNELINILNEANEYGIDKNTIIEILKLI
ncbi:MAG: GntR family transcriptional regulator [Peptoniphilaceae bacterium]